MSYDFSSMVSVAHPLYRSVSGAPGQGPRESSTQYKLRLEAMAEEQRHAGGTGDAPGTPSAPRASRPRVTELGSRRRRGTMLCGEPAADGAVCTAPAARATLGSGTTRLEGPAQAAVAKPAAGDDQARRAASTGVRA